MSTQHPPLVSIVMPVKNASPYLAACIESIIAQDYTHWELMAVDDHSEDDSRAILKQYAESDRRIRVLPSKGHGIIEALRTALDHASGTFITRMDADDLMTPDKLFSMTCQLLDSGPGHLATGCVRYFCEDPLGDGYQRYASWLNKLTKKGENFTELYKECVIPSPCWMVYREDFDRSGGFTPHSYPEDYDLCFRFYKAGLKAMPTDKVLHHWRDHSDRASRNDPNYKDNRFLPLKIGYFLELHRESDRPLAILGAGHKGKKVARLLKESAIDFHWVCNNPNKIGQVIYDVTLCEQSFVDRLPEPQILVCIANPKELKTLREWLAIRRRKPMKDDFYLC